MLPLPTQAPRTSDEAPGLDGPPPLQDLVLEAVLAGSHRGLLQVVDVTDAGSVEQHARRRNPVCT
jgi:hypothetical protein